MTLGLKLALAGIALALVLIVQQDALPAERQWLASLVLIAYALILLRAERRGRRSTHTGTSPADYLVAYATETGTARQLAGQTRKRLRKAGFSVEVTELNRLDRAPLPAKALLLIASTTGNGDAPRTGDRWLEGDDPERFHERPFAVLALGDRRYPRFCAFGLTLTLRLQQAGAVPLLATVQVDQADTNVIEHWHRQLLASA